VALIRPFDGVRYAPAAVGDLTSVVCAPYDVITAPAQADFYARSPFNVVRLELGCARPGDQPTDNRYTRAAATYQSWLRDRIIVPDGEPSLYVYDEGFSLNGRWLKRRSLVAAVRLANWEEGEILPHEHTLPKAKADRLELLAATHTQFSPLLAFYDDPGGVLAALADVAATDPLARLTVAPDQIAASALEHRLWRSADPAVVAELSRALRTTQLYIADGHHRYETALTYRDQQRAAGAGPNAPSEFVLIGLVEASDPGLIVQPTHRIVTGLETIDVERAQRQLSGWFEIERRPFDAAAGDAVANLVDVSGSATTLGVLGLERNVVHQLRLRPSVDLTKLLPDVPEALRPIDTVILQRLIFDPVFGLAADELGAGERVRFTRDPAEAVRAYLAEDAQLAFFLQPTPISQIRAASRAGVRMPQKTTYFWPKPLTGLVFFDHDRAW
jgi:uncharacterized protein (DUF1015 family)